MPSTSKAQHNLMAWQAHAPAGTTHVKKSVAEHFFEADRGRHFDEGGGVDPDNIPDLPPASAQDPRQDELTALLYARHAQQQPWMNQNVQGVGVSHPLSNPNLSAIAGYYHNTEHRPSFYAGVEAMPFQHGNLKAGADIGAITGYGGRGTKIPPVLPVVAPTATYQFSPDFAGQATAMIDPLRLKNSALALSLRYGLGKHANGGRIGPDTVGTTIGDPRGDRINQPPLRMNDQVVHPLETGNTPLPHWQHHAPPSDSQFGLTQPIPTDPPPKFDPGPTRYYAGGGDVLDQGDPDLNDAPMDWEAVRRNLTDPSTWSGMGSALQGAAKGYGAGIVGLPAQFQDMASKIPVFGGLTHTLGTLPHSSDLLQGLGSDEAQGAGIGQAIGDAGMGLGTALRLAHSFGSSDLPLNFWENPNAHIQARGLGERGAIGRDLSRTPPDQLWASDEQRRAARLPPNPSGPPTSNGFPLGSTMPEDWGNVTMPPNSRVSPQVSAKIDEWLQGTDPQYALMAKRAIDASRGTGLEYSVHSPPEGAGFAPWTNSGTTGSVTFPDEFSNRLFKPTQDDLNRGYLRHESAHPDYEGNEQVDFHTHPDTTLGWPVPYWSGVPPGRGLGGGDIDAYTYQMGVMRPSRFRFGMATAPVSGNNGSFIGASVQGNPSKFLGNWGGRTALDEMERVRQMDRQGSMFMQANPNIEQGFKKDLERNFGSPYLYQNLARTAPFFKMQGQGGLAPLVYHFSSPAYKEAIDQYIKLTHMADGGSFDKDPGGVYSQQHSSILDLLKNLGAEKANMMLEGAQSGNQ
jgi:hypothetical protein